MLSTLTRPRLLRRAPLRTLLAALLLALFLAAVGCGGTLQGEGEALFQVSTIDALLSGVYDGQTTTGQLTKHGDLGLGTFNGLDGEMIVLDGDVYQVPMSGHPRLMGPNAKTPFANVTAFKADQSFTLDGPVTYAQLKEALDRRLPSPNLFYAVRVTGRFKQVKARSVPRQTPPYPPLVEVVKHQAVFQWADLDGELVGFYCPAFAKGVNVVGYHLHFISATRDKGGHLLDCELASGRVQIDVLDQFVLNLPDQGDFLGRDLNTDRSKALHKVEN